MNLTAEERTILETRRVRGPVQNEALALSLEKRGLLLAGSSGFVQKRTFEITARGLAVLAGEE